MKTYKSYEKSTNALEMSLSMHLRLLKYTAIGILAFFLLLSFRYWQRLPVEWQSYIKTYSREYTRYVVQKHILLKDITIDPFAEEIKAQFVKRAAVSLIIFVFYPLTIAYFRIKAKESFEEQVLRGANIVDEKLYASLLKRKVDESCLSINSQIKLPKAYENRHFLILGSTGSGKTVFFSNIIRQLRDRGEKAIIYDVTGGEFLSLFFNSETDHVYNPFDERSLHFNLFDSIENVADYDRIATSVIPPAGSPYEKPFFKDTSRTILSAALRYCYERNEVDVKNLNELLNLPVKKLCHKLEKINPKIRDYISGNSDQTQSVTSTLNTHTNCLTYMENHSDKPVFSIADWIESDGNGGSFIFLNNNRKQQDALKGVFSIFINAITNEVLSLEKSLNRRIFFILDEFGTLQRLPAIKDMFVLGRSRGLSLWPGVQEIEQLEETYGENQAHTIINQCNTQVFFRTNGAKSAKIISDTLGQSEIERLQSSYSIGQKDSRDGENYQEHKGEKVVVMPSEIQNLPDLSFYLNAPEMPIVKTAIEYKSYEKNHPGYLPESYFAAKQIEQNEEDEQTEPAEQRDNEPRQDNDTKNQEIEEAVPSQGLPAKEVKETPRDI